MVGCGRDLTAQRAARLWDGMGWMVVCARSLPVTVRCVCVRVCVLCVCVGPASFGAAGRRHASTPAKPTHRNKHNAPRSTQQQQAHEEAAETSRHMLRSSGRTSLHAGQREGQQKRLDDGLRKELRGHVVCAQPFQEDNTNKYGRSRSSRRQAADGKRRGSSSEGASERARRHGSVEAALAEWVGGHGAL